MNTQNEIYELLIEAQKKDKKPWSKNLARLLYTALYVINEPIVSPQYLIDMYYRLYDNRVTITPHKVGKNMVRYSFMFDRYRKFANLRPNTYYIRKAK